MLRTPILTQDQIDVFYNTGALVVRGAFSPAEAKRIQKWTDELAALPEAPGRQWVFHEKSLKDPTHKLISRIEYIHPFHAGFKELAEALRAPVGQLLDEEAVLFKEKVNFKMPGGDGFKPHQDSQAGWDTYVDFFISVLVSIDEATVENGCIEIISGGHKRGLSRSWEPMTKSDLAGMKFVHVPTKPGDLIFFDCYAPHQSQPNLSDKTRRLYYATYNKLSAGDHQAEYYADKHKNYPPDIERDPAKTYVFRV
ncbi:MAG: phytanoyl-CoA dioxygenase family protein [Rhodospirillales bacterium]|nr:phytanoyl-CoA dioxygenase family protein [Rhodospirillales bacterium]